MRRLRTGLSRRAQMDARGEVAQPTFSIPVTATRAKHEIIRQVAGPMVGHQAVGEHLCGTMAPQEMTEGR